MQEWRRGWAAARQRTMMRAAALHCKLQPPSRSSSRARRIARVESGQQEHSSRTRCVLPCTTAAATATPHVRGVTNRNLRRHRKGAQISQLGFGSFYFNPQTQTLSKIQNKTYPRVEGMEAMEAATHFHGLVQSSVRPVPQRKAMGKVGGVIAAFRKHWV
jgi:hypothetical protein